ncbi:hypothetical protein TeGR_g8148 [Tetraparma gracilis]|uniref:Uncharacterized protein n=1 Tax=Tetraparma gracilis TaxID=2962635 RepID=A0ABQ6N805_9STRA|nr:hypothetical protein TeGR_g8148 [Tetraparma gracilis]
MVYVSALLIAQSRAREKARLDQRKKARRKCVEVLFSRLPSLQQSAAPTVAFGISVLIPRSFRESSMSYA